MTQAWTGASRKWYAHANNDVSNMHVHGWFLLAQWQTTEKPKDVERLSTMWAAETRVSLLLITQRPEGQAQALTLSYTYQSTRAHDRKPRYHKSLKSASLIFVTLTTQLISPSSMPQFWRYGAPSHMCGPTTPPSPPVYYIRSPWGNDILRENSYGYHKAYQTDWHRCPLSQPQPNKTINKEQKLSKKGKGNTDDSNRPVVQQFF